MKESTTKKLSREEFMQQAGAYTQDLRNYVYSHLRDHEVSHDLVNDCMLQAADMYDRQMYDPEKSLKNWLFCVAYSRMVDYVRMQARQRLQLNNCPDLIRDELGWSQVDEGWENKLVPGWSSRKLYAKQLISSRFDNLPVSHAQRSVLQLRYLDQLSYKQIASKLNEPLSTVMSRHAYAMRLLRNRYAKEWRRKCRAEEDV